MQQDLTPKQQTVELIKQANHILLVTGQNPNNDQLSAMVALELILKRAGKQVSAIVTSELPKVAKILDTHTISRDLTGIRDFVVRLDTTNVEVDKLRYEVNDNNIEIIVSPFSGNFDAQDASFDYGGYKFDLVIVLGVSQIARIDSILEQNPTIFDGIHLVNIDCHRSNEQYGSVNFVDSGASSVCEMLVGVIESVAQGMIDYHVATAILAGIMGATQGFTNQNTSAKSLTIAAQMMSGGAKQQDIVNTLFSNQSHANNNQRSNNNDNSDNRAELKSHQSKKIRKDEPKAQETIAQKLAKQGIELTEEGVVDAKTGKILEEEVLDDNLVELNDGDEQSSKKFKNPLTGQSHQETSKEDTHKAESKRSKKK
jgi:nanoRNase/pAp phosphatase (c-di-AMP/oligoRNAs hydrolase)